MQLRGQRQEGRVLGDYGGVLVIVGANLKGKMSGQSDDP